MEEKQPEKSNTQATAAAVVVVAEKQDSSSSSSSPAASTDSSSSTTTEQASETQEQPQAQPQVQAEQQPQQGQATPQQQTITIVNSDEKPTEKKHEYDVSAVEFPNKELERKPGRSCWFKMSWAVTKYPWLTFFLSMAVTAGFIVRWTQMVVTSDDAVLFLHGSSTLNTLEKMRASFDEGMLDPFSIIVVAAGGQNNSLFTPTYYQAENNLINNILSQLPQYVTAGSFTGMSFFAGRNVSFMEGMSYFTPGSPTFNTSTANSYRLSVGGLMNGHKSATLIRVSTTISPDSQDIVPFIDRVRLILDNLDPDVISGYLMGGYSSDYDVQNALYALTPYLYASTIALVLIMIGWSFHSVMIAVRLAITIIMSLATTYGLMALVYQPGPAQTAFAKIGPSLTDSSGVYWIIPIMSFSILVGLALDYDIFLMSRVVEFRRLGWSDRASISLAIDKTGGIITAAGVIMAVSFAGLLFPNTLALNQYGFSLAIGVTLDTFLVRCVLVPAVFTALGTHSRANWWPGRMPRVLLPPKAETEAIMAGYWVPPERWPVEESQKPVEESQK